MSIYRPRAVLVSLAATAATLVTGAASPAHAAPALDAPLVVSADLLSSAGDGCGRPAVQLGDGALAVQARTGGDSSLLLDGGTATECVLHVRLHLDQPGRVRPSQYVLSGTVNTSAGTTAGHYFESSFDAANWYGQRTTLPAGSVGPFAQGGGSHFAPWSECSADVDVAFRVGLSLTSSTGLTTGDSIALDAPNGATANLDTLTC